MANRRQAPPGRRKRNDDERDDAHPPLRRLHVAVIVLGDLGRSPRMQYHALSLLEHGHLVTLVGYAGEDVVPSLADRAGRPSSPLRIVRMDPPSPPGPLRTYARPLYLLLRLLGLAAALFRALFFSVPASHADPTTGRTVPVDCVVVQNPPSVPLLLLAYVFCRTQPLWLHPRPGLVIDWHNLGYTMFDLPPSHPIPVVARWYERLMAPRADGHLCVTSAMKRWLAANFGLSGGAGRNVSVLRDRPPEFFRPTEVEEEHRLMQRLAGEFGAGRPELASTLNAGGDDSGRTLFTEVVAGGVRLRKDRPALVISSTSWTPDEDFSILLDACVKLDGMAKDALASSSSSFAGNVVGRETARSFPHVVVVVTGKGPEKAKYEEEISRLSLSNVTILTMWLEAADYPVLLGCADLGVSLHTSTSGIDLPMKVLDCFGCEVPVCAINFDCLDELVVDGTNGKVFETSDELAEQIFRLLATVPNDGVRRAGGELEKLREGIRGMKRWRENWDENAKGVIEAASPGGRKTEGVSDGEDHVRQGEPSLWQKVSVFFICFAVAYALTFKLILTD